MISLLMHQFHKSSWCISRTVLLKVWSRTWNLSESKFSGPTQDLLNQKLQKWGPEICVLTSLPDDSVAYQSLKTTIPRKAGLKQKGSDSEDNPFSIGFFHCQNTFKMWQSKLFITDKKIGSKLIVQQCSISRMNYGINI